MNHDPTTPCWAMSSEKYVKDALRNLRTQLEEIGLCLKTRAPGVLPSGYWPELDTMAYCDEEEANYYQQQIRVLCWIVELGCLDICGEVSMMAAFQMCPRVGHLQAVYHMFVYHSTHERSVVVLDPSYIKHDDEIEADWKPFYLDAQEELPPNVPPPNRGLYFLQGVPPTGGEGETMVTP